jgi:peptidylprolyl isomerase
MRYKRRKSHKIRNALIAMVAVIIFISVIVVTNQMNNGTPAKSSSPTKILLETSMGNITIQLYDDMPITSGNFKNLTEHGVYDGTLFFRVAKGFVIQGGDATPKGIIVPSIQDELPNKHSNVRGSVAMAKTNESNSATSQFFINLEDNSASLDSNYSVFGQVIAGMNVVDQISQVPITPEISATDGKPVQNITIIRATIIG